MGTQKNRLIEKVCLSTQKHMFKLMDKKIHVTQFYTHNFCLTRPMLLVTDNPPLGKGSLSKGDENSDTSQSKVLRDSKIFKNLVPNKVGASSLLVRSAFADDEFKVEFSGEMADKGMSTIKVCF